MTGKWHLYFGGGSRRRSSASGRPISIFQGNKSLYCLIRIKKPCKQRQAKVFYQEDEVYVYAFHENWNNVNEHFIFGSFGFPITKGWEFLQI